jgi:hypothetical protein
MVGLVRGWMILAMLGLAGAAQAECAVSADAGAVAKPLNPTVQADADIIVSMSMMPKLMHIDYASAAKKPACDLGPLTPGGDSYRLWADDKAGRQRKAIPARKGGPVAMLVPVTDIMKALQASKEGKSGSVEGYLLATVGKGDFTGWRYYSGVPDAATLKHDMAEVLTGGASPIFRQGADGKTMLFVPKG